jgi:hypothetical protein
MADANRKNAPNAPRQAPWQSRRTRNPPAATAPARNKKFILSIKALAELSAGTFVSYLTANLNNALFQLIIINKE